MKKLFTLLLVGILLFGCIGSDSEELNQTNSSMPDFTPGEEIEGGDGDSIEVESEESSSEGTEGFIPDGSPMWSGTFTIHIYGGGKEKAYDMTLTGVDETFFDEEKNALDVLQTTYTCTYSESSEVEMFEGMPPFIMSRTGSGSITKEYGEDEFRIYFEDDGTIIGDFSEPNEDWVQLTLTTNGASSSEEGGCLIDDFNEVLFSNGQFEDLVIDAEGRDSIRGNKKTTYGTANMEISFEYHRVEE